MSCIIKRPSGIYYGVYSYKGKRVWRSTRARTHEEAIHIVNRIGIKYESWKNLTILQLQANLLDVLEGTLAPGTLQIYKNALKMFAEVLDDLYLMSITPYHIEKFKSARLKQVSPQMVSIEFRTLKAAFSRAVKFGMIETNPFKDVRDVKIPEKEPRILSKEEFEHLTRVIGDQPLKYILIVAVYTMMRAGELIHLRWSDIDIERGFIHLKNQEGFTLKGRRGRSIPLNQSAIDALRRLQNDSVYVCEREITFRRPVASLSRRFKMYARRAGLPEEIHLHSLRHTGATWLSQKGVPIFFTQKILGHSSISTTLIYTRRDDEDLRKAIQQLDVLSLN